MAVGAPLRHKENRAETGPVRLLFLNVRLDGVSRGAARGAQAFFWNPRGISFIRIEPREDQVR